MGLVIERVGYWRVEGWLLKGRGRLLKGGGWLRKGRGWLLKGRGVGYGGGY